MSDGEVWGGGGVPEKMEKMGRGGKGQRGEGRTHIQGVREERRSEEHQKKVITADGEMNMVLQEGSRRAREGGGSGGTQHLRE